MSSMTPEQLARACADAMWAEDSATNGLGMQLGEVSPGRSEMRMNVRQEMVNGHGTCHGGFIFTLADSAFAFACNTYNARTVAQHCSISFLAPARLGDMLVARAVEQSRAGRSGIYDVRVETEAGVQIALFRGNSRVMKGEFFPGVMIEG